MYSKHVYKTYVHGLEDSKILIHTHSGKSKFYALPTLTHRTEVQMITWQSLMNAKANQ